MICDLYLVIRNSSQHHGSIYGTADQPSAAGGGGRGAVRAAAGEGAGAARHLRHRLQEAAGRGLLHSRVCCLRSQVSYKILTPVRGGSDKC